MVTALITRPQDDSQALAAELTGRGLAVISEPLLDIVAQDVPDLDSSGAQGILATSANGVRALARVLADRSLPVWAVGDSSARVARDLGYQRVESAQGDVRDLARLVAARLHPQDGVLLHAAGTDLAGDLAGLLGGQGFTVRRLVLYRACAAEKLTDTLCAALRRGEIHCALFFSPRTAQTFVTLAQAAGLEQTVAAMTAYALSPAVARALSSLPWAALRVARAPTQASLLAALDLDMTRGS